MAQETRKDPRAKVLTVTVRYKSATLDEFIEHHSHDVSRGGMFIKTVSPFPAGTLLKIEVRIAGDQRVMQGVGRVVWKRESGDARDGAPAGMGVKFIKIDDASRGVIDQLVAKSGGAVSAFERGGGEPAAPSDAPAEPAVPAAKAVRKQTMIGLGSLGAEAASDGDEPKQDKPATDGGFFPETSKEADLPPPEDRTVMKQAAELLQDALREAGGSLDEVGTPAAASSSSVPPPRPIASDAPTQIRTLPSDFMEEHAEDAEKAANRDKADTDASDRDDETEKPAAARASDRAAAALGVSKPGPAAGRPATSRSASASSPRAPASRPSSRPPATATRRVSVSAEEARPPEGASGGKMAVIVLAVAAVGAGLFMLSKSPSPAPAEPPAAEPMPPTPEPVTTTVAPAETVEPNAPAASAAPADSAVPASSASAVPPVPSGAPAASAELVPSVVKPKPAPVIAKPAPRPAPVPKPAAPKPPAEPTVATPTPPAEIKPVEPKPPAEAEPKPPAAETKPVEPKPPAAPVAPKPKPPADSDDNPY